VILFDYMRKKERESGGNIQCPICGPRTKENHYGIKFVEKLGPYIWRYKCKRCGLGFRYDRTPAFRSGRGWEDAKPKHYRPNF